MRRFLPLIFALVLLVPHARNARAVGTSYWTQNSQADFKAGTLEGVVASNLGDVKLSRAIKTLLEQDPQISSVNAMAEAPDGSIYAGTGPHGVLLQIKDDKATTIATIEDAAAILSLVVEKNGAIILGTGGEAGRVLKIDKPGDKPHVLFQAEGVQYVWGMVETLDGNIYAATGPHGQLLEIKPDGSKRMLLDSGENNLLSLISDGKDLLYLGTDPHGLVYRVNRATGDSFVLYNAAESEVSALALDKKGNLFAGTSEAKEEPPAGLAPADAGDQSGGRPDSGGSGVPIPSDRPKEPTPPPPPNPNPGQPDPIPKGPQTRNHEQMLLQRRAITLAHRGISPSPGTPGEGRGEGLVFSGIADPQPLLAYRARGPEVAPVIFALDDGPGDNPAPSDPGNKKKHPKPSPIPQPGKPDPNNPATQPVAPPAPAHPPTVDTTAGAEPRAEGNAIYKIDRDGFVTEVFREPVLILSMVENNGVLLVATGGLEGQVYQVNPAAEETVVLAKVDAKQIMCLLAAHDGKVYVGTANEGTVATMSVGYAAKGTFASPVLDATQISRFGKIHLHGTLPAGTTLTLSTRSGNVKDPDEKAWSKWSDEADANEFMSVAAPSARFLQYRLTLSSADGKSTPVVRDISVAYQIPNLPPQIKTIKIATSTATVDSGSDADASGSRRVDSARHQTIAWEASDPNNDALVYSLYLRSIGEKEWIVLKDHMTDITYEWDTRAVADGRYEVKVVASDAAANPLGMGKIASRISDPMTVDNTPPVLGNIKSKQVGAKVQIDLKAVDRTSTVAAVDYCVDSNKDWQFVLPTDQIYDSPEETVSFTIPGLKPGQHQITLRATDSKGNQSYENLFITVASPTASR